MVNQREYYKGEGGGSPQVRAMVSLMNLCMLVVCLWTKNGSTMHSPTCCLGCVKVHVNN